MSLLIVDGYKLKEFIIAGANKLNLNKDLINSLNVFPVPDGDTGTNMSLTVTGAVKQVSNINSPNIYEVSKVIADSALREARGNSGVILSQLFRGFSKALEGKELATTKDIAIAFTKATEMAYKAVMKPKEGTILTIAKAISTKALELSEQIEEIKDFLNQIIQYANQELEKTRDMLPELSQAGVVDAGGKGLITILEGGLSAQDKNVLIEQTKENQDKFNTLSYSDININYGYCTEFFINIEKKIPNIDENLKSYLTKKGDSIVVVSDDNFIKVHVHTNNPGEVLERALKIGELDKIKIENMRIQHTNLIDFSKTENIQNESIKEYGFVSVLSGEGIKNIFKELGVDEIIDGGQTMNPSIQDFLNSFQKVNSKNIFVLPNNKNIILAAKQAAEIYKDKKVIVINSTSIPQGHAAMLSFLDTDHITENEHNMQNALNSVITGQITVAVRDTDLDGVNVKLGQYISIIEGKVIDSSDNIIEVTTNTIKNMVENNKSKSFLTVYCGEDCKQEDITKIENFIKQFKDIEFQILEANQPVYNYIISIE